MIRTLLFAVVVSFPVCATSYLAAEPIAPGSIKTAPETPAQMQELTDAVGQFNKRDYAGALEMLQKAAKKDPNLPPPNVIMAQFFAQSNNLAGVQNSLERAVIDAPDDPQAYLILGDLALRERRLAESRLLYEKAQSLLAQWKGSAKRKDAMMPQLYGGLASTSEARGNWTEAQKHLEAWLKLDAKSVPALQQLARCLFEQKDVKGALEKLRAAAKISTDMLPPEAVIARWYAQSGEQKTAGEWFVKALTSAPRNAEARLVAAQWAWENGQLEEAAKQADAALQLDPNYYQAKILRGVIALFRKDYTKAEKYFENAHLQSPNDFAASNNLALALSGQKGAEQRKRALEYAENNVKQYPRMADAYSTYGWVLYKLGRLQDAEAALRRAVSGGSLSAETAYYLACVLADRGQHDADAIRLLQGALSTTAPFAQREDAKALLDQLRKTQPQQGQPLPSLPPPAQPQPQPQTTPQPQPPK